MMRRIAGDVVQATWERVVRYGAIGPRHRRARSFHAFGAGSFVAFPPTVIYGEGRIAIGERTTVGPLASISAGMPSQADLRGDPVITIGDRCMLGEEVCACLPEATSIRWDCNDPPWTRPVCPATLPANGGGCGAARYSCVYGATLCSCEASGLWACSTS